jgi:diguanylate cyclase (GGDEF)-like protein
MDVHTAFVFGGLINLIVAAFLLAVSQMHKASRRAVMTCSFGLFVLSQALFAASIADLEMPSLSMRIAYSLGLSGFATISYALLRLNARSRNSTWVWSGMTLGCLCILLSPTKTLAEIALVATQSMLGFGVILRLGGLGGLGGKGRSGAQLALIRLMGLFSIISAVRSVFLAFDIPFFLDVGDTMGSIAPAAIFYTVGPLLLVATLALLLAERVRVDLQQLADNDPLTGASNRRVLMVRAAAILRERRAKSRACLMMLDIDHFKQVNDQHGHQAGDRALRHFADVARRYLPPAAVFARYGGEEFCVLLPGAGLRQALVIANTVRRALSEAPMPVRGGHMLLTVSIGVAECRDEDTVESLIDRADRDVYRAKEAGRNAVVAGELVLRAPRQTAGVEPARAVPQASARSAVRRSDDAPAATRDARTAPA